VQQQDTLAFGMDRCPVLQEVLFRLHFLELIPSMPNLCQVSEMTGPFAGYPPHLKHPSIGSYFGLLNLVSSSVLHLHHLDIPWHPRIYVSPRSLFVVQGTCLEEYRIGSSKTQKAFHPFNHSMRVSRDFRVEILFANVDVQQKKFLREAIALSDCITSRTKNVNNNVSATSSPPNADFPKRGSGDVLPTPGYSLDRLFSMMEENKSAAHISGDEMRRRVDVGQPREMAAAVASRHQASKTGGPGTLPVDGGSSGGDGGQPSSSAPAPGKKDKDARSRVRHLKALQQRRVQHAAKRDPSGAEP
jgi:hypothetical protein